MDRRQTIPKKIRYFLEYVFFRIILFAIQNLTEGMIFRLGQFSGTVVYYCSPKRRKIARINLDIAFGDSKTPEEKNRITRQSMIYMVVHALQCLWITRNTEERVHRLFPTEPEKLEYLLDILKRGKGVFFLMAHYGNWEALGIFFGYSKYCKLCSIARKFDNPYLENFIMRLRTLSGSRIFHKEESPLKMVRALKQNSCVAVMMDQNGGIGGLFVDFFGKKAATPRSLAMLSRSTHAAVIPLIPYPLENGRYKAIFLPELKLEETGDKKKDIFRWTEEYQKTLEKVIREHPEPWMWFHRRWKSRPPEEGHNTIY